MASIPTELAASQQALNAFFFKDEDLFIRIDETQREQPADCTYIPTAVCVM